MNNINCAIYCRKSSEKGLDQEFTSLDNQELTCKSYILSQKFQGWTYYKLIPMLEFLEELLIDLLYKKCLKI